MNFLEECIQDSLPIWESCLNTKFLKGVADGSLPEECFKGYIVDDSLYLREYSKVFAWGMIHSRDMAEIRNYYSLLSFVNESEDATRRYYLKRYGITDEEIQPDNSYQMSGNKISVRTLNLNRDFSEIAAQLNAIVDEHFSGLSDHL